MKKNLLIILAISFSIFSSFGQTTATDFTVTDCGGTSHHLFAELDAGKVIVMAMVDPCSSCIGPSKSALSVVNSFATSNPGKVIYYLTDDVGNTPCATLTSWGTTNGITGVPTLTSTTITQLNYGGAAMPKIVVIARPDHHVFFNQNNGLNVANLTAAINLAIATAGVNEQQHADFQLSVYPNPANEKLTVNYNLNQSSEVNIDIYNLIGSKIKSIPFGKQSLGNQQLIIETETLNNGIYFLRLNVGEFSQIIRFSVAR
jgi:hypothetical protein